MSFTIEWTETALLRIQTLADFIAKKNPRAARQAITRLFDGVSVLAESPMLGKAHPRSSDPSLRRLVVGEYVVLHKVSEEELSLFVLTVRHRRERPFGPDELEGE